MRSILTLALLAGLTALPSPASAEPATRAERAWLVSWAQSFLADPYALRSTQISDRVTVKGVEVICVAFNGKNAYGAYTGVDRYPFVWSPAGLTPFDKTYKVDTATCFQPQVVMRPFPELASIR